MMNILQACGVIAKGRGNATVVATMASMFIFDKIEGESGKARMVPLLGGKAGLVLGFAVAKMKSALKGDGPEVAANGRISSVPLMGGAAGLGLGLAIADPNRKVIVVDGDASLLLELGSLATVAIQAPKNLLHVVIHNGTQFSGLSNSKMPASDFKFADVARAAGYVNAQRIASAGEWAERFPALLAMEGPVFVELMVEHLPQQTKPGYEQKEMPDRQFERMAQEALALQSLLALESAA